MLQDRSGGLYRVPRAERRQVHRRGARSGPSSTGVRPNFSPAVPQLFADVDKDKALKQGVADRRGLQRAADVPRRLVRERLHAASAGSGACSCRPSRRSARAPDDIGQFYVRNAQGRDGAALVVRAPCGHERARSTRCASTCIAPSRSRARPAPGYSSGQALDALEEVAAKTLPPEMGYAWNALSYQEKVASGRLGARARAVARVRVPDPRRALRELVAAVQRAPEHAGRGARRVPRAAVAALRQQRLRADRPRHAGRPHGEERDPDRRVREGSSSRRASRSSTPRSRARGCACGRS